MVKHAAFGVLLIECERLGLLVSRDPYHIAHEREGSTFGWRSDERARQYRVGVGLNRTYQGTCKAQAQPSYPRPTSHVGRATPPGRTERLEAEALHVKHKASVRLLREPVNGDTVDQ